MTDDSRTVSRRRSLLLAGSVAGSSLPLGGCLALGPTPKERVEEHASELEPLGDAETAVSDGYRSITGYERTGDGTLGMPIVDTDAGELKSTEPNAVLFDVTEDGTYDPLGLKWFVPASRVDSAPELFGRTFDGPIESDTPLVPRHYALHVWLFRENPAGLFATYNPAIEPSSVAESLSPVWDELDELLIGGDARRAGYTNTEKCIDSNAGGYGVPFENGLVDGMEKTRPPVLLYRITQNWSYRLAGAEWYVPADDVDRPPSMVGQQFHEPMESHSPNLDQSRHYGLHAWLFEANPRGLFAPYNPALNC